jgi:hypothetical protein
MIFSRLQLGRTAASQRRSKTITGFVWLRISTRWSSCRTTLRSRTPFIQRSLLLRSLISLGFWPTMESTPQVGVPGVIPSLPPLFPFSKNMECIYQAEMQDVRLVGPPR